MGLIGRRRSSFLKIIALLGVIWFMVVFVMYSDDGSGSSSRSAGGLSGSDGSAGSAFEAPQRLPLQGIRDKFNQFIINAREDANRDELSQDKGGAVVDYVDNNVDQDGDIPLRVVEKETQRKVPPKSKKRNDNSGEL